MVGVSNGQSLRVILLGNLLPRATITVLHEKIILLKVNKFLNQITACSNEFRDVFGAAPPSALRQALRCREFYNCPKLNEMRVAQSAEKVLVQKILPTDSSNCFWIVHCACVLVRSLRFCTSIKFPTSNMQLSTFSWQGNPHVPQQTTNWPQPDLFQAFLALPTRLY